MSKPEAAQPVEAAPRTLPSHAARLGPGHHFQGDLTGSEDLVIQGAFKGKIFLLERTLTIELKAEVEGDIEAGDVFISGSLKGNVRAAGRVVMDASADVKGDIVAARISIQDGARFKGSILMNKS
jgi:cytoskeletal protein CcmA (bactofilin family)